MSLVFLRRFSPDVLVKTPGGPEIFTPRNSSSGSRPSSARHRRLRPGGQARAATHSVCWCKKEVGHEKWNELRDPLRKPPVGWIIEVIPSFPPVGWFISGSFHFSFPASGEAYSTSLARPKGPRARYSNPRFPKTCGKGHGPWP